VPRTHYVILAHENPNTGSRTSKTVRRTLCVKHIMLYFSYKSKHRFQDLKDCEEDVTLRHMLWEARVAWEKSTQVWANACIPVA